MQNYGPIRSVAEGLWVCDGEWFGSSFKRRMTVMSLGNDELIVHNSFVLKDEDVAHLKSLGKVVGIVMPNALHGDEIGWMAEIFPESKILVPAAVGNKLRKTHRVSGTLENDWPLGWAQYIGCLSVEGLRILHESVFLHKASKTLVLTDLAFNMSPHDFKNSIERRLMALNRVGIGFGPSWLCDHLFTSDLEARRKSFQSISNWDFDRIVVNHGHIMESGGREQINAAFC